MYCARVYSRLDITLWLFFGAGLGLWFVPSSLYFFFFIHIYISVCYTVLYLLLNWCAGFTRATQQYIFIHFKKKIIIIRRQKTTTNNKNNRNQIWSVYEVKLFSFLKTYKLLYCLVVAVGPAHLYFFPSFIMIIVCDEKRVIF